jgi:hypothetical protein
MGRVALGPPVRWAELTWQVAPEARAAAEAVGRPQPEEPPARVAQGWAVRPVQARVPPVRAMRALLPRAGPRPLPAVLARAPVAWARGAPAPESVGCS